MTTCDAPCSPRSGWWACGTQVRMARGRPRRWRPWRRRSWKRKRRSGERLRDGVLRGERQPGESRRERARPAGRHDARGRRAAGDGPHTIGRGRKRRLSSQEGWAHRPHTDDGLHISTTRTIEAAAAAVAAHWWMRVQQGVLRCCTMRCPHRLQCARRPPVCDERQAERRAERRAKHRADAARPVSRAWAGALIRTHHQACEVCEGTCRADSAS